MAIALKDFDPVNRLKVEEHPLHAAKFPVIDMHSHWGPILYGPDYASRYNPAQIVPELKKHNIAKLFNLDLLWDESYAQMLDVLKGYTDYIVTCPSVDSAALDDPNFDEIVRSHFEAYAKAGVRAVKFWKDMTLYIKDKDGRHPRLDDPRYEPIWKYAGQYRLPIIIHVGEPPESFTPVDEHNEYLGILEGHSDWVFVGDEYASFEEHLVMQENVVGKFPETTFVLAHVGSNPWDLKYVSDLLDKYPNVHIDIAARLSELGRQPYTARKFFIKYQDRIMFGTDYEGGADPAQFYDPYFRFLETFDEYFDYMGEPRQNDYGFWKIYGIGLEDDVLKKIYYENAVKLFKLDTDFLKP